ncbi:hypothetical protein T01_11005 [Trichinella spiralis]|uniref:Uncharacterized protein n=1 Tax=Trichinella spiralis TaxID=6334 RepID=A0A0V1BUB9_TRISP|nr:hypothetical protein T01_11005 [Trichinella spiralis]
MITRQHNTQGHVFHSRSHSPITSPQLPTVGYVYSIMNVPVILLYQRICSAKIRSLRIILVARNKHKLVFYFPLKLPFPLLSVTIIEHYHGVYCLRQTMS